MIKSWKPVVGFSCIILLLTAVLLYTYDNISRLKKELNNRKTYDGEITLINRLLLRTDEYYSQSNKLVFHNDPEIYETLAQQSDSIDLSFGTLKSISRNKPYASLVDSVSLLYTELHRNMDTLVQFAQTNDFSFDAPLLKFVSEVADSLRKDERSTQFTTVQSTTIIVEKPVLVEVSNKKKNRKNKKNAVEEADTLKPSVTNYHQTDTVIRDSTFSSKVGNSLQKIGTEIGRLKTKTSKKQQEMAMRYAGLDAVKNVLFERINSLLQRIRQAEQEQLNARLSQATEEADHTFSSLVVLFIAASILAVIFVVLIIYDIARSNYYRNKLETEKLRAEKLAKDKENFLATMSHEIRTPLNAITGFAYLLKGDTATRTLKPATVETGATLAVPLFVETGELIKVNPETGEYVERVKN